MTEIEQNFAIATQLFNNTDYEAALRYMQKVVEADPTNADYWTNIGVYASRCGKPQLAAAYTARALQFGPATPIALSNLGNHLWLAGRHRDGLKALEEALVMEPENANTLWNLALILNEMGRGKKSMEYLNKAHALNPTDKSIAWDRALIHLTEGFWEEGFAQYECRTEREPLAKKPKMNCPTWKGEVGDPKAVLCIESEQGAGDNIQFMRYIYEAIKTFLGRIVLIMPPELWKLSQIIFKPYKNVKIVTSGFSMETPSFHCYIMSLPHILKQARNFAPVGFPYISIASVAKNLPHRIGDKLKVGIVWAGAQHHPHDKYRSAKLTDFMPLAETPGVRLYSFQKGPRVNDLIEFGAEFLIHDVGSAVKDFLDTACYIGQMDCVVTVDTSFLHLAGAMNVPTIGLIRTRPSEWRWGRTGMRTPWYDSVQLIRHDQDWAGAIQEASGLIAKRMKPC